MASLSRSNSAVELDSTLNSNSDTTSVSPRDIDPTGPDIPHILLEVDAFITKYELFEMRDIIRKGALLFYRPYGIAGIEEDEYLGNEVNQGDIKGKPPGSSLFISICYAAGFLFVFLESSYYPTTSYYLTTFYPHPDEDWSHWGSERLWFWEYPKGFWEVVLLSSIAPLISALLGFWLSLILNRHWGRLWAFRVAAVIALVAFPGKFISPDTTVAFVADIFCVASMTILTSTVLLYISETSEASKRSSVMTLWYFGLFPARGVAYVIIGPDLGPLRFIFSMLAGFLVLGLSIQSLESPYWLAMNGLIPAAFDSLWGFRRTEIIAARDLYKIYVTEDPNDSKNGMFTWPKSSSRLSELFTNRRLKKITMTCILLMLTRSSSAVETALIVTDFTELSVFVLSPASIMIAGSVCGIILTVLLSDRLGRRRMLISLLCGIFVFRLGLSPPLPGQLKVVISIISCSCSVILRASADLICIVYISEVFPLYYREVGVAFIISFPNACEAILWIIASFEKVHHIPPSQLHILILFPVSILLAYFFIEETSKLPLECIGPALERSPNGLLSYRVSVHLPYLFGRYILRRNIELVPFEEHRYSEGAITLNRENSSSA